MIAVRGWHKVLVTLQVSSLKPIRDTMTDTDEESHSTLFLSFLLRAEGWETARGFIYGRHCARQERR